MTMRAVIAFWTRLRRDERALAMIEFAYALPIMLTLGLVGIEMTNFAVASLRVSQMTSNLADTTSRIGENTPLAVKQIRESDINDAFEAVRRQGGRLDIGNRGRVILSSLEQNEDEGQWIHWQRCLGTRTYTSSFGDEDDGETGDDLEGMGPAGEEISAPADSAVMFVEIAYQYEPLISEAILGTPVIRSHAAFLVRDRRDLTDTSNPVNNTGGVRATCNLHNP